MSAKSLVDQISMFVRSKNGSFFVCYRKVYCSAHFDEIISGVKTQNAENK